MIIVRCVICGREMEQRSSKGKIFCSDACCYLQRSRHIRDDKWCKEELQRRHDDYIAGLTGEELQRREERRNVTMRSYYMKKPEELAKRVCHDCGKPCSNYRCADCWKKIRGNTLEPQEARSETEWDYF